MLRPRLALAVLALVALLVSGAPYRADNAASPPLATAPLLDAGQCPASPAASLAPAPDAVPLGGWIRCTCSFCKANPDIDCQISPDGYSIRCKDWYTGHC